MLAWPHAQLLVSQHTQFSIVADEPCLRRTRPNPPLTAPTRHYAIRINDNTNEWDDNIEVEVDFGSVGSEAGQLSTVGTSG